jgi:hypothetical protein
MDTNTWEVEQENTYQLTGADTKTITLNIETPGVKCFAVNIVPLTTPNVIMAYGATVTVKHKTVQTYEITRLNRGTWDYIIINKPNDQIQIDVQAKGDTQIHVSIQRIVQHFHVLDSEKLQEYKTENDKLVCMNTTTPRKHLVVFVHGNHGLARDMYYLGERFRHLFLHTSGYDNNKDELYIMYSNVNAWKKTHDGIQVLGARLADEIQTFCNDHFQQDDHVLFSLVAHSLGGLMIRWAISRILFENPILEPLSIITISSPHLGSRKPSGTTLEKLFKHTTDFYLNSVIGQTGMKNSIVNIIFQERNLG